MAVAQRRDNQTGLSSARSDYGAVAVNSKGASGLVLQSLDGTEHVLWFKNDGTLMHGTYVMFMDPQNLGSAV